MFFVSVSLIPHSASLLADSLRQRILILKFVKAHTISCCFFATQVQCWLPFVTRLALFSLKHLVSCTYFCYLLGPSGPTQHWMELLILKELHRVTVLVHGTRWIIFILLVTFGPPDAQKVCLLGSLRISQGQRTNQGSVNLVKLAFFFFFASNNSRAGMKSAVSWKKPRHLNTKQHCFTYELVSAPPPPPHCASFSESSSYVLKAGDFLSKCLFLLPVPFGSL